MNSNKLFTLQTCCIALVNKCLNAWVKISCMVSERCACACVWYRAHTEITLFLDVNVLRKTMKSTWPIAVSGTQPLDRPNGIQVLPILWRKGILFGTDDMDEDSKLESDIGISDDDDGCPTLDEITLEGAPNIRTLVSDVFLDSKYR